MKKLLTALCLGLWVGSVGAETKWITARDLDNQELKENKPLVKTLRDYVILDNDIKKCYFPELWNNPENIHDFLNEWSENDEAKFSRYTRIYYRLPYDKLPEEILKSMPEVTLHGEYENYLLREIWEKYQRTTTIKHKDDCEKIGNYIFNDLLTK